MKTQFPHWSGSIGQLLLIGPNRPTCALGRLIAMALLFASIVLFPTSSRAADTVIVGTITITNAANITGTNSEAFTINADTRTWTNAVHNPATQILRQTNNSAAAQAIIIQIVGYPLAGNLVLTYPAANQVQWTAPLNAALAISLTGTNWGSVSYVTNNVGVGTVVRVPYTLESAKGRTNVATGLMQAIASSDDLLCLPAAKICDLLPFIGGSNLLQLIDGVLQPAAGTSFLLTNLIATSNTVFSGTVTFARKTQLLSLGTNAIDCLTSSMLYGISPTNDPTQVILSLSGGHQPGQLLILVNYTNAVPRNGAYTLPANSSVTGGGHVIMPEDWVSTNTFSAWFTWQSPDWIMIDAFAANGQPIFQTNVFNTLVVNSNLTVKGNITINNITFTTNDIWHALIVGGVTNLQPVNLTLQPAINLPLVVGTNTQSILGFDVPLTNGTSFVSVRSVAHGDPNFNKLYVGTAQLGNTIATNAAGVLITTLTNAAFLTVSAMESNGAQSGIALNGYSSTFGNIGPSWIIAGVTPAWLYPNATSIIPFYLSTSYPMTNGILFALGNDLTNVAGAQWDGRWFLQGKTNLIGDNGSALTYNGSPIISGDTLWVTGTNGSTVTFQQVNLALDLFITNKFIFGPGDTNVLYRSGGNLVYTNGLTSANGVNFQVVNGNGIVAKFGVDQDGMGFVNAPSGKFFRIAPDGASITYDFTAIGFYPEENNPEIGDVASNHQWGKAYIGSTNAWKFMGVTIGATTNITVNINGTNFNFVAF